MGGRGAFVNVSIGDFTFNEGGQKYHSIGEVDGIKVLIEDAKNVKAPEFSHTANRVYAIIKDGQLKHLSFYDENHNQVRVIDFQHEHHGLKPHVHLNLNHNDKGIKPTPQEMAVVDKVRRRFNLK